MRNVPAGPKPFSSLFRHVRLSASEGALAVRRQLNKVRALLASAIRDASVLPSGRFSSEGGNSVIRPTEPADTRPLLDLAAQTGVFKPHEIQALDEVLTDYHATNKNLGHQSVTFDQSGRMLGFAYYAPAAMTDRTWYLYWIAVAKPTQARGIGGQLLKHVEDEIRDRRGRMLLIETSSLPHYDLTRKFYVKHHYDQAAVIADFYAEGDDLVVFRKQITR